MVDRSPDADASGVWDLLAAATAADGVAPLNEAARLALQHPRDASLTRTVDRDGRVAGLAVLVEGAGQLVVRPELRRRRIGSDLLDTVRAADPAAGVWAFGDLPAARGFTAHHGLAPVRTLLRLEVDLATRPPLDVPFPPGVSVRSFRPGKDEEDWLAVNARAFAGHPEQGRMTLEDLADRMAEDWFDADGFLVAERDGHLVGSHWTKVHGGGLGEVYVLGVDPAAVGGGLGKALLHAGLAWLQGAGSDRVQLYVEGDHERAIRLYRAAGFVEAGRDVLYAPAR